jgi:hypothetical protein
MIRSRSRNWQDTSTSSSAFDINPALRAIISAGANLNQFPQRQEVLLLAPQQAREWSIAPDAANHIPHHAATPRRLTFRGS